MGAQRWVKIGKLNLGSEKMSPRKLTAADKKAIVSTYRSSAESTTALADRYGVSSSTISRLLKNNIPEDEYELLISERRVQKGENEEENLLDLPTDEGEGEQILNVQSTEEELTPDIPRLRIGSGISSPATTGNRRVRRRSSAIEEEESLEQNTKSIAPKPITRAQKYSIDAPVNDEQPEIDQYNEPLPTVQEIIQPTIQPVVASLGSTPMPILNRMPNIINEDAIPEAIEDIQQDLSMVASIFGEEMADMSDLLDDDDDDLPDEEGWSAESVIPTIMAPEMQVMPLASATLPRTCYIVVDKFAELVACPLRDFVELGQASSNSEAPQNTLPVFDSQRVAKRFSNARNQRVIKVPDSGVFYKTIDHLLAKGISLMLVDGRIYSLR
jgi:transposase-like protein